MNFSLYALIASQSLLCINHFLYLCIPSQAGGELTDFIIVLRTYDAVKTFCSDTHVAIGAGMSAAVGIVGRNAEAGLRAGDGGYAACYTYSCSKGHHLTYYESLLFSIIEQS